jgi:hypothetical protein
MLFLFDRFGHFHCEAPMYARENDSDHCREAPVMLLAGWHEQGGNSTLVNGRPIDGDVGVVTDHRPRPGSPVPPPFVTLTFPGGRTGKERVSVTTGTVVRVTGVVADDAGHDSVAPEIHPVYAIDVVSVPRRKVALPTGDINLTGAWHGSDVGTYYVRQSGDTVWWLGLSRDQGRSFANVFHGTMANGVVEGTWADVPMGFGGALSGGTLTFQGGPLSTELVGLRSPARSADRRGRSSTTPSSVCPSCTDGSEPLNPRKPPARSSPGGVQPIGGSSCTESSRVERSPSSSSLCRSPARRL